MRGPFGHDEIKGRNEGQKILEQELFRGGGLSIQTGEQMFILHGVDSLSDEKRRYWVGGVGKTDYLSH